MIRITRITATTHPEAVLIHPDHNQEPYIKSIVQLQDDRSADGGLKTYKLINSTIHLIRQQDVNRGPPGCLAAVALPIALGGPAFAEFMTVL